MTVTTLPDLVGAVLTRLRAIPEVTALTADRISGSLQDGWDMPTLALWVNGPIGSPGGNQQIGLQMTRLDFHCYGPTMFEAKRLWRTVHPAICPRQDSLTGFVEKGCRVLDVESEGGPIPVEEPDVAWPSVVATYLFLWSEVPVP